MKMAEKKEAKPVVVETVEVEKEDDQKCIESFRKALKESQNEAANEKIQDLTNKL